MTTRKCVKTPRRGVRCGKPPCYRPARLPPGHAAAPPADRRTTLPHGFSTVVERCCGIRHGVRLPRARGARGLVPTSSTRARAELPETTIVMWFSDVRPAALDDDVLTLAVPSALVRERLQHNHLSLIEEAAAEARRAAGEDRVRGGGGPAPPRRARPSSTEPSPASFAAIGAPARRGRAAAPGRSSGAPGLPFPNYTFDAFVPGPVEPLRSRGGDGRGRGAALHGVQPAVHLRRGGPGQDPPADRGRAPHAPAQPAGSA